MLRPVARPNHRRHPGRFQAAYFALEVELLWKSFEKKSICHFEEWLLLIYLNVDRYVFFSSMTDCARRAQTLITQPSISILPKLWASAAHYLGIFLLSPIIDDQCTAKLVLAGFIPLRILHRCSWVAVPCYFLQLPELFLLASCWWGVWIPDLIGLCLIVYVFFNFLTSFDSM